MEQCSSLTEAASASLLPLLLEETKKKEKTYVFCDVLSYTGKAYHLRIENFENSRAKEIWLPQKAIEAFGGQGEWLEKSYRLARWFKPSESQKRVFHRLGHVGGIGV